MSKSFRLLAAIAVFVAAFAADAEVFTLWPWRGSGGVQARLEGIPGISTEPLYKEKLTVNGVPLELEVYAIDFDFSALEAWLKARLRPENLFREGDTIRVTYRLADNYLDRWLLIGSGPGKPVACFRISAPEKLPEPAGWPGELPPLPDGATPVQVIHLEGRDGWYGSFSGGSGEPEWQLRSTADRLKNEGWSAVGDEARPSIGGTGDLFLRARPRTLLWVIFNKNGGSFYSRPY